MKILIFLHGTVIMHRNAAGHNREERVQQFFDGDESLHDFASYVPVDHAVEKLCEWSWQGADIAYLSSHRKVDDVAKDVSVLHRYGFPEGQVYFRQHGGGYADVAESLLPDLIVEDDAKCIGGEKEMVYPNLKPEVKKRIKSIVVDEFGGVDHLPDDITELMVYATRETKYPRKDLK